MAVTPLSDMRLMHQVPPYRFDDSGLLRAIGSHPANRMLDLVDIALATYTADRCVSRRTQSRGRDSYLLSWARTIPLAIPVREPQFWNDAAITRQVTGLLHWLTDDHWQLSFPAATSAAQPAPIQLQLAGPPAPDTVALFSGGLDSLAGTARHLEMGRRVLLVTASTGSRMQRYQADLHNAVGARSEQAASHAVVRYNLPLHLRAVERSQRSRAFVHLVLGAVAATTVGVDELLVYENGIGALNLPYSEAQVGTHSTRAMHPRTIFLTSALMTEIIGRGFTITNTSFEMTKAQLVRAIPGAYRELVPMTVSCDGYPVRLPGTPLCGVCTSCVLRRQSLHAAGMAEVDQHEPYAHDVLAITQPDARYAVGLAAMLEQVAEMHVALRSRDPWTALVERFPALGRLQALSADAPLLGLSSRLSTVELIRAYAAEWDAFPSPLVARYLPMGASA